MMREVAVAIRVFPRSMSDLEPGERITDSKGIRSHRLAVRTNVQLNLLQVCPGELPSGSPAFLMQKRETPGAVYSGLSARLGTKI